MDRLLFYTCSYQGLNILGALVLIHGGVMHRSARNSSLKPRHAYTFHMVETKDCKYRKTNWLQPTAGMPFPKLYEN